MKSTRTHKSTTLKYLISALILGVSIGISILLVWSRQPPEDRDVVDLTQTVEVVKAVPYDGDLKIEVSGVVQPHREVAIAAQVAGEIVSKAPQAQAGSFVQTGDVLMTIDPSDYDLEIRRLNAELKQAESAITELDKEMEGLQSSSDLLEKEYRLQQEELRRRERVGNALSEAELDQTRRGVLAAERLWTEMQNSIRLAEARKFRLQSGIELSRSTLEKAELNRTRTNIVAPFDGVLVADLVEEGDYVRVGDELLLLEDTAKADVTCNLRGHQVLQILKYQVPDSRFGTGEQNTAYRLPPTPVTIVAESGNDRVEWEGVLQRYDGIGFDEQTKMIPVRVVVDQPVARLENGRPVALVRQMFVDVIITLNPAGAPDEGLLSVPEETLHPGNRIWVVENNQLQQHAVTILDRFQVRDEQGHESSCIVIRPVDKTLAPGAEVVRSPLAQPTPGSPVRILPQGPGESAPPAVAGEPAGGESEPASTGVEGADKRS